MTTSDSDPTQAAFAGLPDPELVASWANEFFKAGLEAVRAPAPVAGTEPLTAAPAALAPIFSPASLSPEGLARAAESPSSGSVPLPEAWSGFIDVPAWNGAGSVEPTAQPSGSSYYFLNHAPPASASAPANAKPATTAPAASAKPAGLPDLGLATRGFEVERVRRDFPILDERVNNRRLVWLDNAATTQKPQVVIDRISYFYEHENSNVHRGAHTLAARSSDAYEASREIVRKFINAPSAQDIVFVRGATEGINLVAQAWGRRNVHAGDEIIITWLEHHSNIVPWQQLASETGARLRVVPIDDSGQVRLDEYEKLFNPRTRFVSLTQVSNALGTVTPAKQMIEVAHRYGVPVLVDGAQAVSHFRTDVQALDADFYVFSGHKVFGPTGIGALYGRSDLLAAMPPWQGGGNMIADVTFEKVVYNPPPSRFEAGTGNIADAVGLGAALTYLDQVGLENVARYEHDLLLYLKQRLQEVPKLRLIGNAREQAGVQSFVIDGLANEQIGGALAREGIAVRAGHHCAQPALRRFGLEGTVRPSLALYNTCEDVDALIAVLLQLQSGW